MPLLKLLCLFSPDVPVDGEWQQILTDFDVRRVNTLAEAHEVLSAERMDCALVAGTIPDVSFAEVLELLQHLDTLLPFVFQEKGMTAADAVCLIRLGAYHCFSGADSSRRAARVPGARGGGKALQGKDLESERR